MQHALETSGIAVDLEAARSAVRVKRGDNGFGNTVTYMLNYSSTTAKVKYAGAAGRNVLTGKRIASGELVSIEPWDLIIAESDGNESAHSK